MTFHPAIRILLPLLAISILYIGYASSVKGQNGLPGSLGNGPQQAIAPNLGPSATTTAGDGFQNPTLVGQFVDPSSGTLYGRYIQYESVPVSSYEQKEVIEKQWVPEWVTENKLTTVTQYVPVVTYQLQLQSDRSLNPFTAPRQYWQYVPIVQYQPNYQQVNQPIAYQKYTEKEFRKLIPVLTTQQQKVPRFADVPLQAGGSALASQPNGPGAVPNSQVAESRVPTRPLGYMPYPNTTFAQAAPPSYYVGNQPPGGTVLPPQTAPGPTQLATMPAYNPNYSGWNLNNPWLTSRQTPAYPARYLNNPNPNAFFSSSPNYGIPTYASNGLNNGTYPAGPGATPSAATNAFTNPLPGAAIAQNGAGVGTLANNTATNPVPPNLVPTGYVAANNVAANNLYNGVPNAGATYNSPYYPASYPNTSSSASSIQMPNWLARTGSIFQNGIFRSNAATNAPQWVASNPAPFGGGTVPVMNTSNNWSDNGIQFIPRAGVNSTQPSTGTNWNVVPINNYRDPSQMGIPASVLR